MRVNHSILPNMILLAAVSENGVIGRGNALIWRLPADMKFFRQTTMGHTVMMGRNTYESIGSPLKGRRNIVLTTSKDFKPAGCEVVHSLEGAIRVAGKGDIYVIGGGKVYEQCIPIAGQMIITHLHHTFEGDTFFPAWNQADWQLTEEREGETNAANPYAFTFRHYARIG